MSEERKRILVVEADASMRESICTSLERHGLIASSSPDAAEAIKFLQSPTKIELVYTNIDISGSMDGLDLARWILDHRSEIAILLVSTNAGDTKISEELYIAGKSVRLQKTHNMDGLAQRIHEIIQRNDLRLSQEQVSRS